MSTRLPGYLLNECLYEGIDTVIYRARKEADFSTVIVKAIKVDYPSLEEIIRLRHEYQILQALADVKGVIKVYSIENYGNSFALILEDFAGLDFRKLVKSEKLTVFSFLPIAIQLAETLYEVHQHQIIHKDINPQNILLEPENWAVKLIDFSIASRLSRETTAISNSELLEGTLAYISPEQTGRMNRSLDYRSDFYSLGVTFYEWLTGQLPFNTNEPLELIHCHIAKNPIPPHHLNSEIPPIISDIVMKLMAKNAEDRYQSALGLKVDLESCIHQLQSNQEIINFTAGKLDKWGHFFIPQKLYGRETEVCSLLDAFERVSAGDTEVVMVSGYSGIGKTSIINEVHKLIVEKRGYFISGKFDQFKKNIPYAAPIQAFTALIQQLLTQSTEKIAQWKDKLLAVLANNGQIIIEVIPELEYIIGKQPAVPELPPSEFQNRFKRVFQQFIRVFAQPEHPLVIFLDDWQWASSASLNLIENFTSNTDSKYLLVIGAYRDNEVSPTHPAIVTIEKMRSQGVIVNDIVLGPLTFSDVSQLIADTLDEKVSLQPLQSQFSSRINQLAELIYNKTQGNPFFITQLLQSLYLEKLLQFDFNQRQWQWDIEEIQAVGISDYNVIELMARNIQKLPESTQQVLKLAACIGNQFNLYNLAIINKASLISTANELWEALQAGLILPLSTAYKIPLSLNESEQKQLRVENFKIAYKFLHDRVQQAAYCLIPEQEKKQTHLDIGKSLLSKYLVGFDSPEKLLNQKIPSVLEENIFDIVNQLNIGADLITDSIEKQQLAILNLIAGKKAKASNAYEAATKYLNFGLELLPESSWQSNYDTALALHIEAIEAEYINTNYAQAKQLSDVVIAKAHDTLEKVKVYETKIQFHIAQNQMLEAISIALEVLEMLGVHLDKQPNKFNILSNGILTKFVIGGKRIEDLANLPEMTDPYKIAAMRILIPVLVPAYLTTPNLFPIITFKMVNLSVRYGNSPQSAYGYVLYGWLLCGALGDINSGYKFGQLAMKLLEKFDTQELQCKIVNVFNAFIRHWQEHGRETIPHFEAALQMSLETGNIEYAGYSSINYCHYKFLLGEHLENVSHDQQPYIDLMVKLKQEYVIHSVSTVGQTVLNLLGQSENPCQLIGTRFNEAEILPICQQANIMTSLFMIYFYKSMLLYLFKDYQQALENAELAEKYTGSIIGFMTFVTHKFYYSLILLASYRDRGNSITDKEWLKKVEANLKQMKNWANHAPENYLHKYYLLEAEKAQVLGQDAKATQYYDQAIKQARESGYIQEEALANELATEFYFLGNKRERGELYLLQAYYAYIRWGAKAKVKDLEARYTEFFATILQREETDINEIDATTYKTTTHTKVLDAIAIAKALQVIAAENNFNKLICKLMQIAIENVGASKGLLFLSKAKQLELVVQGSTASEVSLVSLSQTESLPDFPVSVINYVERTQKTVVLNNATVEGLFTNEPYIQGNQTKSILSMPIIYEGKFTGILYLENNLTMAAFTEHRVEVLKLLASQASISLNQQPVGLRK